MVKKFSTYLESIRWYDKGRLTDPEEDNIPDYDDFITNDEFRDWLIDHNAYEKYIYNVKKYNKKFVDEFKFYDNDDDNRRQLLNYCFTWSDTPENSFWSDLNDKWKNYLIKKGR